MLGLSLTVTSLNSNGDSNGQNSLMMGIINHVAIVMTFSSIKMSGSSSFNTITANTTINGVQMGTVSGGSTQG
jgi:hypothetical protein